MRNLIILSLLLMPFLVKAQRQTEYNRRGDEAMQRKDYQTAMLWYEEGVSNCDRYSIDQLTFIWKEDPTMHVSMRVVLSRCLSCLSDQAINNKDTLAIKKIIEYHSEGIGTAKNEVSANYWKEQLEQLRNPITVFSTPNVLKEKMKFMVGYHASLIAPFGIQFGGMGKTVGWYVRFGSNLSFQNARYDCIVDKLDDGQHYIKIQALDDKKAMYRRLQNKETWFTGSAGIMFKVVTEVYVSAGIGYWDRKYYREFIEVNDKGKDIPGTSGWAKDTNSSMNGITVDLDGTYVFNGKFYGSLGVSIMKFKYVYPTLGVGVYF